jgi:hypothetical protein
LKIYSNINNLTLNKVNSRPHSEAYMSKECLNLFQSSSTLSQINCGTKYVCDKTE